MVKDGAVIVDVGITRVAGVLKKDIKLLVMLTMKMFLKNLVIFSVPGGVGPMTIAMLLKNTLLAYKG